jgi:Spx/MgsR family transcriptional regulator
MMTVYGIKQCDTCRKALKWMEKQGIEHSFHDVRADGLKRELVEAWLDSPFADQLVNRRSTTWRGLSEEQKLAQDDALTDLLLEYPTLVKRPVFERGGVIAVGFNPPELEKLVD